MFGAIATLNFEYMSVITSISSLPQVWPSLSKSGHSTSSGRLTRPISIILFLSGLYGILARVHILHLDFKSWTEACRPGQQTQVQEQKWVYLSAWWKLHGRVGVASLPFCCDWLWRLLVLPPDLQRGTTSCRGLKICANPLTYLL